MIFERFYGMPRAVVKSPQRLFSTAVPSYPAIYTRERGRGPGRSVKCGAFARDGAKRKKGSKLHLHASVKDMAVDTLGHLLTLFVTPADEQDRSQVDELCEKVQKVTGNSVEIGYVDQGFTGEKAEAQALAWGIQLEVVKLPDAKKGFVLLPKRWVHTRVNAVVERSFAWAARFRRLAKDYERLPETVAGLHFVVLGCLMLAKAAAIWKSA